MKITKRQLRRIIREVKGKVVEHDWEEKKGLDGNIEYEKKWQIGSDFPLCIMMIQYSPKSPAYRTPAGYGLAFWTGHSRHEARQGYYRWCSPNGDITEATSLAAAGSKFIFEDPEEAKRVAISFASWAKGEFPEAFEVDSPTDYSGVDWAHDGYV